MGLVVHFSVQLKLTEKNFTWKKYILVKANAEGLSWLKINFNFVDYLLLKLWIPVQDRGFSFYQQALWVGFLEAVTSAVHVEVQPITQLIWLQPLLLSPSNRQTWQDLQEKYDEVMTTIIKDKKALLDDFRLQSNSVISNYQFFSRPELNSISLLYSSRL